MMGDILILQDDTHKVTFLFCATGMEKSAGRLSSLGGVVLLEEMARALAWIIHEESGTSPGGGVDSSPGRKPGVQAPRTR